MTRRPSRLTAGRSTAARSIWHTLDAPVVADRLGVDLNLGLAEEEVRHRAARFGPNAIREKPPRAPWRNVVFLQDLCEGIRAASEELLRRCPALIAF